MHPWFHRLYTLTHLDRKGRSRHTLPILFFNHNNAKRILVELPRLQRKRYARFLKLTVRQKTVGKRLKIIRLLLPATNARRQNHRNKKQQNPINISHTYYANAGLKKRYLFDVTNTHLYVYILSIILSKPPIAKRGIFGVLLDQIPVSLVVLTMVCHFVKH